MEEQRNYMTGDVVFYYEKENYCLMYGGQEMLTIADIVFNENTTIRGTAFFFHRNEGVYKIGLNIAYLSNVFEEEMKRRKDV